MIKLIKVKNPRNEELTMTLARPEQSGFAITKIEGLGPSDSTINMTDLATLDGSVYNSAKTNSRNITLSITFVQTAKESIEHLRRKTYKYFPNKGLVQLYIQTDTNIVYTSGYVEKNEPDIFSSQESCTISIVCPDPNLYYYVQSTFDSSEIQPLTLFDLYSKSFTDQGSLEFSEKFDYNNQIGDNGNAEISISYDGDVDLGYQVKFDIKSTLTKLDYNYNYAGTDYDTISLDGALLEKLGTARYRFKNGGDKYYVADLPDKYYYAPNYEDKSLYTDVYTYEGGENKVSGHGAVNVPTKHEINFEGYEKDTSTSKTMLTRYTHVLPEDENTAVGTYTKLYMDEDCTSEDNFNRLYLTKASSKLKPNTGSSFYVKKLPTAKYSTNYELCSASGGISQSIYINDLFGTLNDDGTHTLKTYNDEECTSERGTLTITSTGRIISDTYALRPLSGDASRLGTISYSIDCRTGESYGSEIFCYLSSGKYCSLHRTDVSYDYYNRITYYTDTDAKSVVPEYQYFVLSKRVSSFDEDYEFVISYKTVLENRYSYSTNTNKKKLSNDLPIVEVSNKLDKNFKTGDVIDISSLDGNKSIKLTRSHVTREILNIMSKTDGANWPKLTYGINKVSYKAMNDATNKNDSVDIVITNKQAYSGV